MGQWIYNNVAQTPETLPENVIGFIYKITHKATGRWYIGRKNVKKTSYKTVKGKKKKVMVDSDWMTYNSSSDELKEWMKLEGDDNFVKEILIFTYSASQTLYGEEAILYHTNALFDENCLNNNIRAKVYRKWYADKKNDQFKLDMIELKKK